MAVDRTVELVFKARTAQASRDVKGLGKDLSDIGAKATATGRQATHGLDQTSTAAVKAGQKTTAYNKRLDIQRGSIADLRMRTQRLIEARDRFANPHVIERYNRTIDKLQTKMRHLQRTQPDAGGGSFLGGSGLRNFAIGAGAAVGAVQLLQRGISRAIDKGSEFESKLAELEAITGIAGDRLDRLGNKALDLSKKYGESAGGIVEANKLVASQLAQKIDFNTEKGFQELQDISEQAIVLQKAAGVDLSSAVAAAASAINQFNLPASEAARVVNTLAAGSKFGAAEVPLIARAMVNAGAAAFAAGQSIETTNAAIQVLAANGQVGERAGTALRSIFTRLQTKSEELAELGIGEVDIRANGLATTLQQLQPVLKETAALQKVFGDEALNQVQILVRNADALEEMTKKVTGTQVAHEQAAVRMDTFEGAAARLSATIDAQLVPAFRESGGALVEGISLLAGFVKAVGNGVRGINRMVQSIRRMGDAVGTVQLLVDKYTDFIVPLRIAKNILEKTGLIDDNIGRYRELFETIDAGTVVLQAHIGNIGEEAEEFARLRNELDEVDSKYASFNRLIAANRDELIASQDEFQSYQQHLKDQREGVEEGSFAYVEYGEKIKQAEEALGSIKSKIQSVNGLLKETAGGGIEMPETPTPATTPDPLDEQLSKLKETYQSLINQPTLDDAGLFEAIGIVERIQELEELRKNRDELANFKNEDFFESDYGFSDSLDKMNKKAFDEIATREDMLHQQAMQHVDEKKLARLAAEQEVAEKERKGHQERIQRFEKYVTAVSSGVNEFRSLFSALHSRRIQEIEEERDRKLQQIDAELARENLGEAQRARLLKQRDQIGRQLERQLMAEKKKQFNLDKAAKLSEIAMNTAVAVSKVYGQTGIFGVAAQVPVIAMGAAQAATIVAQPNPYAQGGIIGGRRHRDGGTIIEAEKDEFIVNRLSSMQAPRALEYMNRSPSAARAVEIMFDRSVDSAPSKMESGGRLGLSPPVRLAAGPQPFDSGLLLATIREAVLQGMGGVVIKSPISSYEIDQQAKEFGRIQSIVGNE